jgi:hypothetical protein
LRQENLKRRQGIALSAHTFQLNGDINYHLNAVFLRVVQMKNGMKWNASIISRNKLWLDFKKENLLFCNNRLSETKLSHSLLKL